MLELLELSDEDLLLLEKRPDLLNIQVGGLCASASPESDVILHDSDLRQLATNLYGHSGSD
jgi:hypothetical protein